MKKKSIAISSPKVNPAMDTAQQPSDLAQTDAHEIGGLLASLREVIKTARQQALRAVDVVQVQTCWTVGQHIVEYEQGGAARAVYGKRLLADLAESLTAEFGKGFDDRNLWHIRTLHTTFPNWNALRSDLIWTQTSYLRKSAESVDKVLADDPQITQIRADLSNGGMEYELAYLGISYRLAVEFGKGFDSLNLSYMRLFCQAFPKCDAVRHELSWTQTSYLRKSAESVDKVLADEPQISQIRTDLSNGGQI